MRFHANFPLYKTHIGCGIDKDFERRCGQRIADYYSSHLETEVPSSYPENTQSNIVFNESLTHGSLVFCQSHLEAVKVVELDEYDDMEATLHGEYPTIRAGDIVRPCKRNKGDRLYFPYTFVISGTSLEDKVCNLIFICSYFYYVLAFHSCLSFLA